MTLVHFAAQSQSALAAELLLVAGVVVDVGDRNGNRARFDAVFSYRVAATLQVLLAAGVDPERQNAKGVSPRALADLRLRPALAAVARSAAVGTRCGP
ncbi:hypothetical protein EF912_21610 [Streptomyces sp. WAC07061]|uniref:hypothetical protein n=1 Tax=Streptomyces sp. WAC07061 TaxID=2487410 RepID=UPI000F7B8D28|nr:hypothetical protein [Streptomyces sp. WAC07061]RSS50692.1 hypothetical protein EF912_21610 [Streptomyces sp. WAC07061]